jgi:hypothetical protein
VTLNGVRDEGDVLTIPGADPDRPSVSSPVMVLRFMRLRCADDLVFRKHLSELR